MGTASSNRWVGALGWVMLATTVLGLAGCGTGPATGLNVPAPLAPASGAVLVEQSSASETGSFPDLVVDRAARIGISGSCVGAGKVTVEVVGKSMKIGIPCTGSSETYRSVATESFDGAIGSSPVTILVSNPSRSSWQVRVWASL